MLEEEDDGKSLDEEIEEKLIERPEDQDNMPERHECYHILDSSRRMSILRFLNVKEDEDPFELGEIADYVAEFEHGDPSYEERHSVRTTISQQHLPKMDDYGAINYDDRANVVAIPEDEQAYILFQGLTALVDDQLFPDNTKADDEYYRNSFARYGEEDQSGLRSYLSF